MQSTTLIWLSREGPDARLTESTPRSAASDSRALSRAASAFEPATPVRHDGAVRALVPALPLRRVRGGDGAGLRWTTGCAEVPPQVGKAWWVRAATGWRCWRTGTALTANIAVASIELRIGSNAGSSTADASMDSRCRPTRGARAAPYQKPHPTDWPRTTDELDRHSGTRVWRKVSGLLADDEFVLQLMEPGA